MNLLENKFKFLSYYLFEIYLIISFIYNNIANFKKMIYNNFNFQGMILMKTNKQVRYSTTKINLIDLNVLLCNQGTNVF